MGLDAKMAAVLDSLKADGVATQNARANQAIGQAGINAMQAHNVESVMVDGQWLMRDHTILTVNEAEVFAEAKRHAAAIAERAVAQTYPSRPVTMIVPASAGGPTDAIARVMS